MTGEERHRDYEALRDDLAAYALGALPEDDAAGLEEHLEACPRCRDLLRWLSPAVDVLPAAVPQLSPPSALRERVMAVVREEAAPKPGPSRPERWWGRRPARAAPRPAIAVALVATLAVGLAGGYAIRGDEGGEQPEITFVEARPLTGDPNVSATLERRGDSATLHVHELPGLPPSKVYEVWVERGGVMEPSTLFVVGKDGSGRAAVPGPLEGAERVLVTAEPRGGSQSPTSPPLLAATL
ncbi:MAG: anti-sigma factor domain-containing protein [Solirubrobacterales bacterium]